MIRAQGFEIHELTTQIPPGRIKAEKSVLQNEIHTNSAESGELPYLKRDFLYTSHISCLNYKHSPCSSNKSIFFPTKSLDPPPVQIAGILLPWTINWLVLFKKHYCWVFHLPIIPGFCFWFKSTPKTCSYYFLTPLSIKCSFGNRRRVNGSLKLILPGNPCGCSKGSLHTSS